MLQFSIKITSFPIHASEKLKSAIGLGYIVNVLFFVTAQPLVKSVSSSVTL